MNYDNISIGRGIGTIGDNKITSSESPRRRYPNRSSNYYDPGSVFRNPGNHFEPSTTSVPRINQIEPSFAYEPYPTINNSRSNVIVTRRTTATTTLRTTARYVFDLAVNNDNI